MTWDSISPVLVGWLVRAPDKVRHNTRHVTCLEKFSLTGAVRRKWRNGASRLEYGLLS